MDERLLALRAKYALQFQEEQEGAIAMYRALSTLWPAIVDPSKRPKPKWY